MMLRDLSIPDAPPDQVVNVPHNIEAEQALLGALFVNNEVFDHVSDIVKPDHFYDPLHARIYRCIENLCAANRVATPISLKTYFEGEEPIAGHLTVPQYLARLAANATTLINAQEYAELTKDLYLRRQIISLCQESICTAYDACPEYSSVEQLEELEAQLFHLNEYGAVSHQGTQIKDIFARVMDHAFKAYQCPDHTLGIPTGFVDLDKLLGGLQNSDLIILAGRPSMGKTSLSTNIAFHAAKQGFTVGFFSLEMSDDQLGLRILSEASEICSSKIRNGWTEQGDLEQIHSVSEDLSELPIFVDSTGGLSIAQFSIKARRWKRQHGIQLLVVDYIQLMQAHHRHSTRVQEVTEISNGLKALAKELNIPVIALSQLSRGVESRENKRPQLSDLRESGAIEQDADVVMFLYREEYYLEKENPGDGDIDKYVLWQEQLAKVRNKAELIIAKQRHGSTGVVHLVFRKDLTRFESAHFDSICDGGAL